LLDLKEKRLEERVEEVEGALLHFMFLKKAIDEALVSMFVEVEFESNGREEEVLA
jgi:hypothetical protein